MSGHIKETIEDCKAIEKIEDRLDCIAVGVNVVEN
jgi:hypothetical protein